MCVCAVCWSKFSGIFVFLFGALSLQNCLIGNGLVRMNGVKLTGERGLACEIFQKNGLWEFECDV